MVVRFLQNHSPYRSGHIAGVPNDEAKKLIDAKVAERYSNKQSKTDEPDTKQVDEAPRNKQVQAAPKKK